VEYGGLEKFNMAMQLEVPEGYYFDYLSILAVKGVKQPDNQNLIQDYMKCFMKAAEQLGEELITKIVNSEEFDNLVLINLDLYDYVDLVKQDKVTGKQVDAKVYERFLAKKALQEKFFPSKPYTEQKFGYDKKI
jgi:hypothetical protein